MDPLALGLAAGIVVAIAVGFFRARDTPLSQQPVPRARE